MTGEEVVLTAVGVMGGIAMANGIVKKRVPSIKQVAGIFGTGLALSILTDVNDTFGKDMSYLVMMGSVLVGGDAIFQALNKETTGTSPNWPTQKPKVTRDSLILVGTGSAGTPNTTLLSATTPNTVSPTTGAPNAGAAKAISAAMSQIGLPYRVANPGIPGVGFNCSSLTGWAWGQAGHPLPPLAVTQYEMLTKVPYAQALPGDLVFYHGAVPKGPEQIGHVGLYIGSGKQIDAPGHCCPIGIRNVYGDHFPLVGRVL